VRIYDEEELPSLFRCLSVAILQHRPRLAKQNPYESGLLAAHPVNMVTVITNMQKHITILAALHIAYNGIALLGAIIIFLAIVGGGLLSGDAEAIWITAGIGTLVAVILLIVAAPGLIGGVVLLKRISWARILVLIIGCLNLLNFPFGTALGVYTIWVLIQPETKEIFDSSY
jgi:hypothetical protein